MKWWCLASDICMQSHTFAGALHEFVWIEWRSVREVYSVLHEGIVDRFLSIQDNCVSEIQTTEVCEARSNSYYTSLGLWVVY